MLNLSNLDAILCTTAHAAVRKHGTYMSTSYEHMCSNFFHRISFKWSLI